MVSALVVVAWADCVRMRQRYQRSRRAHAQALRRFAEISVTYERHLSYYHKQLCDMGEVELADAVFVESLAPMSRYRAELERGQED